MEKILKATETDFEAQYKEGHKCQGTQERFKSLKNAKAAVSWILVKFSHKYTMGIT